MSAPWIRTADVVRLVVTWFRSFLALLLTARLLPGFTHTSWLPLLGAAAATGRHGGLGDWQDSALVLGPTHLLHPDGPILGGAELHRHLIGILESQGHRASLQRSTR